jgi:uncharacterized protein (DUF427 family)
MMKALAKESVWDYPRPPRLEKIDAELKVVFNGITVAETNRAYRVLETSHPPVYYFRPEDVKMQYFRTSKKSSYCEWKGKAKYLSVTVGGRTADNCAWYYPSPVKEFEDIKNFLAFYPQMMDACYVNGEQVISQDGDFYGGWITSNIIGPIKGAPGTLSW